MSKVYTSQANWVVELSKYYRDRMPVTLVDDAKLGVDPVSDTLLQMGMKGKLGINDWVAVVIALGVAATGAYLVVMAVLDPEPFSKIGFALAAGAVMTMGGGFAAVRVLTKQKPPSVKVGLEGFELGWN